MKKFLVVAIALMATVGAWAQGTFTIRRPVDGSTVRETVKVRIPKNSIPDGGYIGIVVNGKFVEAVLPDVEGSDYVYNLDSKKRGLSDGKLSIEVVLYVDFGKAPQVVNRSSVNVTLDNQTSIKIPAGGLRLRYGFQPGREFHYNLQESQTVSILSQAQAQLGSRAAEIPTDAENFRFLYAIDGSSRNKDGSKEGLVRMQPLPNKGKDYAYIVTAGETQARKFYDYEMHAVYQKLTDTGREIFGSVPQYFPLEGTSGESQRLDLFAVDPLPVLPTKSVKPGDVWQAPFLLGILDLTKLFEVDKLTAAVPSRGVFEGVEWQNGIPCARIRQTIAIGAKDLKGINNVNQIQGKTESVKAEQLFWFALDRGMVAKVETTFTIEVLIDAQASGGGNFGGGGPSGSGPSGPPRGGSRGGKGGDIGAEGVINGGSARQSGDSRGGGRPGNVPGGGAPGGFGAPGGGAPSGGAVVKQILRIVQKRVIELEK